MKTKLKKWLILIVWMFIIFIFSNQPHSGSVTHDMVEQILPNIKFDSLINIINFTIRKLAHLSEYFILTLLTISLSKEYIKKEKIILLISLIFCFIFALTDEYHQSLVPGRTSVFTDVIIDTIGGILSIITYKIYTKIKTKN